MSDQNPLHPHHQRSASNRRYVLLPLLLAGLVGAAYVPASAKVPHAKANEVTKTDFYSENDAAMVTMMAAMHVEPTGDVDRDFAEMMIPHHQGAIDMAVAMLRHGKNAQLRRIAQEIIIEQQQEIAAMRLALDQPLPPSMPAPTDPPPSPVGAGMATDLPHAFTKQDNLK